MMNGLARRAMSAGHRGKVLRIVIVDGYAQKSRDEFAQRSMPLASTLYKEMLVRQAPKGTTIEFETLFPCTEEYVAPSDDALGTFDAAAFTGSSYSAYAPDEDVVRQVDLMRRTFDCGVSSFGSCWGVQIAAVALGGTVALSPKGREVGIGRKVSLTPEGRGHPMYTGKKSCFHAFMSHGDEVVIPPSGAVITSSNDHSRIQGMAVTRNGTESWFVQYHPEYDLKYYAQLIGARKERMTAMGFFKNEEQIDLYVEDFTALHDEGAEVRKDVAWQYGIDEDIWNMDLRQCEARNWLKHVASLKFEPAY